MVRWLRNAGHRVDSVRELGFAKRADEFHLAEAGKRDCILLSNDADFLNDHRFPFALLKATGVVVLSTAPSRSNREYGYMLGALLNEIGSSNPAAFIGFKIEIRGPLIRFRALFGGRVRVADFDTSKSNRGPDLFAPLE